MKLSINAWLILCFAFLLQAACAQKKPVIYANDGAAINGYDPVAYFTDQKPVKGNPAFSAQYMNATWHFASAAHRDAFTKEPEKFAPQYGGYCAYGLAKGYKAPTIPEAWTVLDGKLYLNYDRGVQTIWDKDRPGYVNKANTNWPTVQKN